MNLYSSILGAALVAVSTFSFAQAPGGAPTDAQKQERREKMKAAYGEAEKACQGKQGDERRSCMTQQMCAKAPNPQQCQEHAKERAGKMHERHDKMKQRHEERCKADPAKCEAEKKARMEKREKVREACKGKQGDDLKSCIRDQRSKK